MRGEYVCHTMGIHIALVKVHSLSLDSFDIDT